MATPFLNQSYDEYPRIEVAFQAALDESLHPRGPSLLYDIVGQLGLPSGAAVIDLGCGEGRHAIELAAQATGSATDAVLGGCGEGRHAIELAERFGFAVQGIDPVPRTIALASETLREALTRTPELGPLVRFQVGAAESLPLRDARIDLIGCREVIYVIASLDRVFAECRRVLRPGGRLLIYCNFVTNRLELSEWWYTSLGMVAASAEASNVEAAFLRQGFRIEQSLALGSEFGEYAQETTGEPGRRLLYAARLLRDPERYIARFGQANYDIMLNDCFWHIYRMIGKLSPRVYLLMRA